MGNNAWRCNTSQSAGVKLETMWYYWNVGNAELHGTECWGTIQRNPGPKHKNTIHLGRVYLFTCQIIGVDVTI
jgi:hypothetical protein